MRAPQAVAVGSLKQNHVRLPCRTSSKDTIFCAKDMDGARLSTVFEHGMARITVLLAA